MGAFVVGAVVLGVFVAAVVGLLVVDRAGDVGAVADGTRSGPGAGDVVALLAETGGGGTDALDTGPDHTPSR